MCRRIGALLAVLTLLLSGCWSRIEVNDLGVVTGLAIDVGEQAAVRVTMFLARSGGEQKGTDKPSSGGSSPVWLVAREAETISDAFREVAMASSRRLSLHHLRVVLVSEEYARKGLAGLLDFLTRYPETRMTIRPMIVVGGRAQDILATPPQLESLQPENLVKTIEAKGGVVQNLKNFLVARVSQTHSGWMHTVHQIERPAQIPGTPDMATELDGAALFYGDRLVETLDRQEAQALAWLLENPRDSVVTAPCPASDQLFSVRVERAKTQIRPSLVGNTVSFLTLTLGEVDLRQVLCPGEVESGAVRLKLEQALEEDVRSRLLDLIKKTQAHQTDPAGFGKRLQLKYPAYFRQHAQQWPAIWAKSKVTVTVQLHVRHTGLITLPLDKTRDELGQ